jgi:hypothetical protein
MDKENYCARLREQRGIASAEEQAGTGGKLVVAWEKLEPFEVTSR